MEEFINKRDAYKALIDKSKQYLLNFTVEALEKAASIISQMPVADVKPVNRGKWVKTGYEFTDIEFFRCSSYKYDISEREMQEFDYCPKCGADMRNDEKR